MSGQISQPYLLQRLAERLDAPVSAADKARAVSHLVDWLGCAVAGAREPAGCILLEGLPSSVRDRAFAWGGLGNILEMDDVDKRAVLHPGPSIIPAALAMATDGADDNILDAIIRGYEATIRLGRAVGPSHYAFWHSTGTCGAIGSAVATANLLKLDREKTSHAMALALSQSAGLWQTRHEAVSMGKQLHTAHAARAGMEAALLARGGFLGPLGILEGEQGFFSAMCADGNPEDLLFDYGARWLIHDVSFKPWPACRHAHAAIDAALLARTDLQGRRAEQIIVRTYEDALKFCNRAEPRSSIEAKFSLQHAVAAALVHGTPEVSHFSSEMLDRTQLKRMRDKVQVEVSDTYQSVYPARYGAEVEVRTGAASKVYAIPDALGDPENPLSLEAIYGKAHSLLAHAGLKEDKADALILATQNVEQPDGGARLSETFAEALAWPR